MASGPSNNAREQDGGAAQQQQLQNVQSPEQQQRQQQRPQVRLSHRELLLQEIDGMRDDDPRKQRAEQAFKQGNGMGL